MYMHPDLCKRLSDLHRREMMRRAEVWNLGQRRQRWLGRQGCRLLYRVGQALIRLGRRLEGYGMPSPALQGYDKGP